MQTAEEGSFSGGNTVSNGAYLVAACPTSQELALHPLLQEVTEGLLGPYGRRVALAVASEIKVWGAGAAQVLHRDDEEWPLARDWLESHRLWNEIQTTKERLDQLHARWLELNPKFTSVKVDPLKPDQ